jgi:hypothetical protein
VLGEEAVERLAGVNVVIADLSRLTLGFSRGDTVWIDATAAGHGWFVDATPADDSEYHGGSAAMTAARGSDAGGWMDLLSVMIHEFGHQLGFAHEALGESLAAGTRLVPASMTTQAPQDAAVADASESDHATSKRGDRTVSRGAAESLLPWVHEWKRRFEAHDRRPRGLAWWRYLSLGPEDRRGSVGWKRILQRSPASISCSGLGMVARTPNMPLAASTTRSTTTIWASYSAPTSGTTVAGIPTRSFPIMVTGA